MKLNGYVLENQEKITRVIQGTPTQHGVYVGGVGENAAPEVILAAYDKLGGLVTKNGLKVKTGAFYDFKKKTAKAEPELKFEVVLEDAPVEVTEEEALAITVAQKRTQEIKKRGRPSQNEEVEGMPKVKRKLKVKDPRDDE